MTHWERRRCFFRWGLNYAISYYIKLVWHRGKCNSALVIPTVLCEEFCNDSVDDGEPIFSAPAFLGTTAPLREDAPLGKVVYTLQASDTEYYRLNTPPPDFGLNGNQIVVTGFLDYETTREYVLNVRWIFVCHYAQTHIFTCTYIQISMCHYYICTCTYNQVRICTYQNYCV